MAAILSGGDELTPNLQDGGCQDHMVWASWQIRKIAGYAGAGNAGSVFPATAG